MSVLSILVLLATLADAPATAPTTKPVAADAFPNTWIGTWRGPCTFTPADGKPRQFEMELRITPTEDPARYSWTIVYIEGNRRQERPYELIVLDADAGRFVIDERNSIRIESRFLDGGLYSQFAVGEVFVTASYRRHEGTIQVELITSGRAHMQRSGGEQGVPEVLTHPVRGTQRAILHAVR